MAYDHPDYDLATLIAAHNRDGGGGPVSLAWIRSLAPYRVSDGTWSRWVRLAVYNEVPASGKNYVKASRRPKLKKKIKVSLLAMVKLLVITQHHSPTNVKMEPRNWSAAYNDVGLGRALPTMKRVKPLSVLEIAKRVGPWIKQNGRSLMRFDKDLATYSVTTAGDLASALSAVVSGRLGYTWVPKWYSVVKRQAQRVQVRWRGVNAKYTHKEVMAIANEIIRTLGSGRIRNNLVVGDIGPIVAR
jgi:hypothetical protein